MNRIKNTLGSRIKEILAKESRAIKKLGMYVRLITPEYFNSKENKLILVMRI